MSTNEIIIEKASPFNVEKTVELIIAAAQKKEWQNPANHNLQQSLAKSGKIVRPVQVIEICKPEYSGMMLEKNHERIASVILPCRISVYEKEDGVTYIAMINLSSLTNGMQDAIHIPMLAAANETFEIVNSVIGL